MKEIKYLENGMEVSVIRDIDGGVLVSDCYSCGDEEKDFFVDDKIYFVKRVFDRAPTHRLDAKIAELEEKIKTAQKKYIELETSLANAKKEMEEIK